jgi:pyruvate formate lyase activating enzyme
LEGIVFNIQRYSIHDGPGIRTTVFLKGCNLRCFWCHNPESWKIQPEIIIDPSRCIGCLRCAKVCPSGARRIINGEIVYYRELCKQCGKCVDVCYSGAIAWIGKKMKISSVVREVERDIPFYERSGGGVTLSGGEPLLQIDFIVGLLRELKRKKINIAIDTAGNIPWENFEKIMKLTDIFLFDIKSVNRGILKEATGGDNKLILNNLMRISESGKRIIIRIPIIPSITDSFIELTKIAEVLEKMRSIERIELLTFHKLGSGKFKNLGIENYSERLTVLDKEKMNELSEVFMKKGLNVQVS